MDINERIQQEFNLTTEHTTNIVNLLDEGNTKSGYFNIGSFKDGQTLHFAIGYPF